MSAWGESDWRLKVAEEFVFIAKSRGFAPGNKNALNRLIFELAVDETISEELRKRFHHMTLQTVRGQSNFVTGALKRFWIAEIPQIGFTTPEELASAIPSPAPEIAEKTPKKAAARTITPAAAPQIVRPSLVKQRPVEFVVSLRLDNVYDTAQIKDILTGWLHSEFPNASIDVVHSVVAGEWHDFRIKADQTYSQIRGTLMQVSWIKECVSKPVSDFGMFWACL